MRFFFEGWFPHGNGMGDVEMKESSWLALRTLARFQSIKSRLKNARDAGECCHRSPAVRSVEERGSGGLVDDVVPRLCELEQPRAASSHATRPPPPRSLFTYEQTPNPHDCFRILILKLVINHHPHPHPKTVKSESHCNPNTVF